MTKITGKRMQEDWDNRAKRNAYHYIDIGQKQWTDQEFLQAGFKTVRDYLAPFILEEMEYDLESGTILEVGVGAGRLLWWTRDFAEKAIGVDVSTEMLAKAKKLLRSDPGDLRVLQLLKNNGEDLSIVDTATINIVYSWTVLQHIPDTAIQLNYIKEMGRVLKSGGLFILQLHADFDEYSRLYPEWKKRQEANDVQGWEDSKDDLQSFTTWMCNPIQPALVYDTLVMCGLHLVREEGQHTGRWILYGQKEG
jgi:SAM-dependent methyltransferase